jgi:hypothetical protein
MDTAAAAAARAPPPLLGTQAPAPRLARFGERVPIASAGAHAVYADACAAFVCGARGTGEGAEALEPVLCARETADALRADFAALFGGGGVPFDPCVVALAGTNAAARRARPVTHVTLRALLIMAMQARADQSDAAVRVLLGDGDAGARRAVTAEIVRLLARPATRGDDGHGRELFTALNDGPKGSAEQSLAGVPSANFGALGDATFARLRACLVAAWRAHALRLARTHLARVRALAAEGARRPLICIASGGESAAAAAPP